MRNSADVLVVCDSQTLWIFSHESQRCFILTEKAFLSTWSFMRGNLCGLISDRRTSLNCNYDTSMWECSPDLPLLSVVAYSVVMGALMASGKEVIGRIPKGKVNMKASLNGNVKYESLLCQSCNWGKTVTQTAGGGIFNVNDWILNVHLQFSVVVPAIFVPNVY